MVLPSKPASLGGLFKTIAVVNDLEERVETLEGSGPVELQADVEELQEQVQTMTTGLLDRTDQLETDVQTAMTGLLDRADALEARASFLSGTGAPDNGDGANGDLYLDTMGAEFYIKAAGMWASVGTLA